MTAESISYRRLVTTTESGRSGIQASRTTPSFERTIDRSLVHRLAVAEVFLTDITEGRGAGEFAIGAQLPRRHSFYRPVGGVHDSMLLAEVLRQSVIGVAHTFLGAPADSNFTMQSLGFEVADWTGLLVREYPLDLEVHLTVTDTEYRSQSIASMQVTLEFLHEGRRVATGQGHTRIFDSSSYAKIRWPHGEPPRTPATLVPVEPVPTVDVGVLEPADVVLGVQRHHEATADSAAWPLRVNTAHPVLFDHSCDHVPGMLLLEAVRQATRLTCGDSRAMPKSLDMRFIRFGELGQPVWVSARTTAAGAHEVTCFQRNEPIARATIQASAVLRR